MNKETRQMIVGLLLFAVTFLILLVLAKICRSGAVEWYVYPLLVINSFSLCVSFKLIEKSIK